MKRNQKLLVLATLTGVIWLLHSYYCDWVSKTGDRGIIPGLLAARSLETRTGDFLLGVVVPFVLFAGVVFCYLAWAPLFSRSEREGRWMLGFLTAGSMILIGIALSIDQGRFGGRGSVFVYVGGMVLFVLLLFATGDFSEELESEAGPPEAKQKDSGGTHPGKGSGSPG